MKTGPGERPGWIFSPGYSCQAQHSPGEAPQGTGLCPALDVHVPSPPQLDWEGPTGEGCIRHLALDMPTRTASILFPGRPPWKSFLDGTQRTSKQPPEGMPPQAMRVPYLGVQHWGYTVYPQGVPPGCIPRVYPKVGWPLPMGRGARGHCFLQSIRVPQAALVGLSPSREEEAEPSLPASLKLPAHPS